LPLYNNNNNNNNLTCKAPVCAKKDFRGAKLITKCKVLEVVVVVVVVVY